MSRENLPANAVRRMGLGTVQFGLQYGVSAPDCQVSQRQACDILQSAFTAGVRVIDTAPAYGNSESVVGQCTSTMDEFSVITKTAPTRSMRVQIDDVDHVRRTLEHSLVRLGRESLYGVLVHHAEDLLVPGGERLFDMLREFQAKGKAIKIGVSIYTGEQVRALLEKFDVDLVQLPLNIFDQRLIADGTLALLKARQVEIHVRSAFLQGLLLMRPEQVPDSIAQVRPRLNEFRERCRRNGMTPLAAALQFVLQQSNVDCVIVGVHTSMQLQECINVAVSPSPYFEYEEFACDDERIIDPRRWN